MAYNVKFLKGTLDSYNAIQLKDSNTFYYVEDSDLYLGEIKLSNAQEIAAAVDRISINEENIQNILDELDALNPNGGTGSITTQIQNLRVELLNKINDNYDLIIAETDRAKKEEGNLQTSINAINEDMESLLETVADNTTLVNSLSEDVEALSSTVKTNKQDITNIKNDLFDLNPRIAALEELPPKVTSLEELTQSHSSKLNILIGTDIDKSARQIAAEELAVQLIPENAKESLDELKEIAAWIQQHPQDAAAMNTAIQENTSNIAGLRADVNSNSLDISSLKSSINSINNSQTGILAQSKKYTDSQIDVIEEELILLQEEVDKNTSDIADINDTEKGLLAQVNVSLNNLIDRFKLDSLGTAAYKGVEFFDAAGSAAAAYTNAVSDAKDYTDEALTWGIINK